jgi:acyl carrier protein
LSINWGPWGGSGMASTLTENARARLAQSGIGYLSPSRAISLLQETMAQNAPQIVLASLDLSRLSSLRAKPSRQTATQSKKEKRQPKETANALTEKLATLSEAGKRQVLLAMVQEEMARVLALPSTKTLHPTTEFRVLGMDSLISVEFRNSLSAKVGKPLPATLVFDYPNPTEVANYLLTKVFQNQKTTTPSKEKPSLDPQALFASLSAAQLQASGLLAPLLALVEKDQRDTKLPEDGKYIASAMSMTESDIDAELASILGDQN